MRMQVVLNALVSGSAIALLAVAFQAVYLPTRVFFLGLAGVYALAPFVAYAVLRHGGAWPLAILLATGACVAVSVLAAWANHVRLARRRASDAAHLITSLGIYLVIIQIIAMAWGNGPKSLRSGIESTVSFGGLVLTYSQVTTGLVSMFLLSIFAVWLRWTHFGLQFRALAEDPIQLARYGYNTDRLQLIAFALSGFLASASSLLVSYEVGFDPHVGLDSLLIAVVAVIVGGRQSFFGSAVAGFLVGAVRAEVAWFSSAQWQDAATFVLLVFILFFRPQGMFTKKLRLEART